MKIDNKKVNEWLNNNNINYISDFDISKRSWLKAGGVVKIYITPRKHLKHNSKGWYYLNSDNKSK